jgi:hypothetical protein
VVLHSGTGVGVGVGVGVPSVKETVWQVVVAAFGFDSGALGDTDVCLN